MDMNKKLYRSRNDKMISGVCAGIANYLNIDPTLVRVIYAVLSVFTAFIPCLILYIVLAIDFPPAPLVLGSASTRKTYVKNRGPRCDLAPRPTACLFRFVFRTVLQCPVEHLFEIREAFGADPVGFVRRAVALVQVALVFAEGGPTETAVVMVPGGARPAVRLPLPGQIFQILFL